MYSARHYLLFTKNVYKQREGLLQHTLQRVFYSIRSPPGSWVTEICQISGWWECHTQGRLYTTTTKFAIGATIRIGREIQFLSYAGFSKHRPSGPMLSISWNVRLSVCPSVRLFTFKVPYKRLFAPTSRSTMSNIFRDWGKVMERSGLRFEDFCLEVV